MPYLQKKKRNKTTRQKQTRKSQRTYLAAVWTVYFWRSCRFRENVKDQNDWDTFSPYFSDDGAQLMCQRKGFTHCDPRRGLMRDRRGRSHNACLNQRTAGWSWRRSISHRSKQKTNLTLSYSLACSVNWILLLHNWLYGCVFLYIKPRSKCWSEFLGHESL